MYNLQKLKLNVLKIVLNKAIFILFSNLYFDIIRIICGKNN